MYLKRRNTRYIEISTGFLLILSVLSFLVSFLLNFNYTIPHTTFEEDIDFLTDSISSQKFSAIAWIVSGVINLFFLPVYLILFNRFQKGMHILSGLFILGMAYSFFNIGINELHISKASFLYLNDPELYSNIPTMFILPKIRHIMLVQKIGITAFGAFATVLIISRYNNVSFPLFGSVLAFLAGPVVITFIWLNANHIILTSSLAVAWTGLLIIGVRMINKGLDVKTN